MLTFTPEQSINRIRLEFKDTVAGMEAQKGLRINRIRLEFKVGVAATLKSPQIVLIESDWNLKQL